MYYQILHARSQDTDPHIPLFHNLTQIPLHNELYVINELCGTRFFHGRNRAKICFASAVLKSSSKNNSHTGAAGGWTNGRTDENYQIGQVDHV